MQNSFEGILISGLGPTGNVVLGNFIGTNASGADLGNVGDGVLIDASINNTIGWANTIGHNGTISSIGGAVGAGIQILPRARELVRDERQDAQDRRLISRAIPLRGSGSPCPSDKKSTHDGPP